MIQPGSLCRCYNNEVSGAEPRIASTEMPPLTIRKPETLANRLDAMEAQAEQAAAETLQKTVVTVKINGAEVQSIVTPPAYPKGRYYRLFYVNGKRTAKGAIPEMLLA